MAMSQIVKCQIQTDVNKHEDGKTVSNNVMVTVMKCDKMTEICQKYVKQMLKGMNRIPKIKRQKYVSIKIQRKCHWTDVKRCEFNA